MPVAARWDHTLDLRDIWKSVLPFEEQRAAVVARIKASRFYAQDSWGLEDIVVELATADSVEEFDEWWDEFYDWADEHRVWVSLA